ncbi:hypothetical protein OG455_14315 [Kitasatospora sp. NBC_01287]|uniref:hypothetical protein n=1 Tax=Kitasatospora sp. NBC_01287 TaxID=2903573 RepID=UPI00224E8382|nr:hypothetical protein [Kitasatospora sp. NBC_01287]MCX4746678.1 hypothetical protein [Kitasatospora sp. NBC_01287]
MASLRSEHLPTEVPRHRWRLLGWGLVVALVVGAGVTGLWWRPWQSVALPKSACWGELGPADYGALAGDDGAAKAADRGSIDGPVATGVVLANCRLMWSGGHRANMLTVAVGSADDSDGTEDPRLLGSTLQAVDFGPDAKGWIARGAGGPLAVQFACGYRSGGGAKASPYLRIVVSGDDLGDTSTAQVRSAYAGIALKVAKAVAHRLPCGNEPRLPAQPGFVPPG